MLACDACRVIMEKSWGPSRWSKCSFNAKSVACWKMKFRKLLWSTKKKGIINQKKTWIRDMQISLTEESSHPVDIAMFHIGGFVLLQVTMFSHNAVPDISIEWYSGWQRMCGTWAKCKKYGLTPSHPQNTNSFFAGIQQVSLHQHWNKLRIQLAKKRYELREKRLWANFIQFLDATGNVMEHVGTKYQLQFRKQTWVEQFHADKIRIQYPCKHKSSGYNAHMWMYL